MPPVEADQPPVREFPDNPEIDGVPVTGLPGVSRTEFDV